MEQAAVARAVRLSSCSRCRQQVDQWRRSCRWRACWRCARAAAKRDEVSAAAERRRKQDGLQRRDGLVYSRSGAVYVPDDRRLKTRLLELAHDAVGHFGRDEDGGETGPTLRVDRHDQRGRGLLSKLRGVRSQQELERVASRYC